MRRLGIALLAALALVAVLAMVAAACGGTSGAPSSSGPPSSGAPSSESLLSKGSPNTARDPQVIVDALDAAGLALCHSDDSDFAEYKRLRHLGRVFHQVVLSAPFSGADPIGQHKLAQLQHNEPAEHRRH